MTYRSRHTQICEKPQQFCEKRRFPHQFVRIPKLTEGAESAQQLGLSGEHAGEQKEALEQLLFVIEGDGQPTGIERNPVG